MATFNLVTHDRFETLAPYSSQWDELLTGSVTDSPFLKFDFVAAWWEHKGGGEWNADSQLAIITAHQENDLIGIAPLFITQLPDGSRALYNLGAVEICDLLDVIVHPENHAEFVEAVLNHLLSSGLRFDVIRLYNLPSGSPTIPALEQELGKANWSHTVEQYQPSPTIHLSPDFDSYLAGIDKKQRHEIKRKIRRAEESGRSVRWYFVDDAEKLPNAINSFFSLMAGDPSKESFLSGSMRVQMDVIIHTAFKGGYLKFAFLEADGEIAASYLMFDHQNKLWVYNSGYNRNFNDLSVGWVLLGYLIDWACQNQRAEFDFLRGSEDYKFKFGAVDRPVMMLTAHRLP